MLPENDNQSVLDLALSLNLLQDINILELGDNKQEAIDEQPLSLDFRNSMNGDAITQMNTKHCLKLVSTREMSADKNEKQTDRSESSSLFFSCTPASPLFLLNSFLAISLQIFLPPIYPLLQVKKSFL